MASAVKSVSSLSYFFPLIFDFGPCSIRHKLERYGASINPKQISPLVTSSASREGAFRCLVRYNWDEWNQFGATRLGSCLQTIHQTNPIK
jgi:hypothetical protein